MYPLKIAYLYRICLVCLFVLIIINLLHVDNQWEDKKSSKIQRLLINRIKPRKNIVFLKTHKCGTETLVNAVFKRYGLNHNLTGVVGLRKHTFSISWPRRFNRSFMRRTKQQPNLLCDHTVFDQEAIEDVMPANTFYATILREPFSQFKSWFNYMSAAKLFDKKVDYPISVFLTNPTYYEHLFNTHERRKAYCFPPNFSITKNPMSFDLGLSMGYDNTANYSNNLQKIQEFIINLKNRFNLVMIFEYYDLSIVLLRRLLNWNFRDILYIRQNKSRRANLTKNPMDRELYKTWSLADHLLYSEFNKTFWEKVGMQVGIWSELKQFQNVLKLLRSYCNSIRKHKFVSIRIERTIWNPRIIVNKHFCNEVGLSKVKEFLKMQEKNDNFFPGEDKRTLKLWYC
ncbi:DgyrCDS1272 [Dimorphilus gyrociliatus]|uniref:DgyrCDS1272 n=1 Tax=Dimorphilus gyrociliatus TaxID=2664684 RepID=A0A7I8V8V9_9ANNE|nr:DgyrCDS1272 [Dimorphilus gyrociliatus]